MGGMHKVEQMLMLTISDYLLGVVNSYTNTISTLTFDLTNLSPEERWKLEHRKMHLEHQGHEKMHLEMFLVLLGTLVLCQVLLVQWRNFHFRSYQLATLIGMWVIPLVASVRYLWWRFITTWLVFSVVTGTMTWLAVRKPLSMQTPRRVYVWFVLVYKLTYALGILGYVIVMGSLFGLNMVFSVQTATSMDVGLLCLFYGLYYGVVTRDFAEVCSEKMASHIGYFTTTGVPTRRLESNVCAICGNPLEEGNPEPVYQLACTHVFHEFCIRGWCIVGKKETCPYCKERVDLKRMFKNPWEKPHVLYGNLLDWIRYLVAWQPVIVLLVQGINWILGLH